MSTLSVSTNEILTIRERIFDGSDVTPAVRANDTTDIHVARGASYPREPARPFRTALIDHAQCGQICCDDSQRQLGANLGLYSLTFNNDVELDRQSLEAYRLFRIEAEQKGFRHFLEVFDPNAPARPIGPKLLGGFINDLVARTLAGVASAARPVARWDVVPDQRLGEPQELGAEAPGRQRSDFLALRPEPLCPSRF